MEAVPVEWAAMRALGWQVRGVVVSVWCPGRGLPGGSVGRWARLRHWVRAGQVGVDRRMDGRTVKTSGEPGWLGVRANASIVYGGFGVPVAQQDRAQDS